MAFDVGVICAMVSAVGLGALIAQAALITGGDPWGLDGFFLLGENAGVRYEVTKEIGFKAWNCLVPNMEIQML